MSRTHKGSKPRGADLHGRWVPKKLMFSKCGRVRSTNPKRLVARYKRRVVKQELMTND